MNSSFRDKNSFIDIVQRRNKAFFRFVDKRIPAASSHRLSQKNLFIFPTLRGFVFLLIAASLWVLGTNYQNNLILALAFFMVSLFVLAIMLTFQNMNQLQLEYVGQAGDAYAGDEHLLKLKVATQSRRGAEEIELTWTNLSNGHQATPTLAQSVTIFTVDDLAKEKLVPLFCEKRGVHKLPRLRVQSYFPLGIIRCWTWLQWKGDVVVYPKPLNGKLGQSSVVASGEADGLHPVKGAEDFSGLKSYIAGDSLRHISWKTYAKGRGLFVKEFAESLSNEIWLNFDTVQGASLEERLSVLTFWVRHYYQENENYGLNLPGVSIPPGNGFEHRNRCLLALAKFK